MARADGKAGPLEACRATRGTEAGLAFRRLLGLVVEELKEDLAGAKEPDVPRLQGAIAALRAVLRDIEAEPCRIERPDGAYV
jgi:hypothetical protein